eukprot:tig00000443_g776.t1
MRRPVDSSAIRREGRAMSKATGCEGSLDFNTDEGDGPVGLDSKVLNAAGVVQAKAVQEPLQGRQAWARIQESARLRDGLSAGRRASGWSGEELRSRPGRRPPQNVAPAQKVLGSRGCSTCFDSKHSGRQASCIQSFEPVWLRAKRLAFWQETASCTLTRFVITHCVVDPTTYLVGSETEGGMTSVAGICEYISRTEGPDAAAAVAADVENGELDETIAAFGPRCRLFSYRAGGIWQTYIRGIAIQFFEPADPENGPFPVKASIRGRGKRTRNSAPAFVPPPPPSSSHGQQHAGQQHAGQQRIDEMLPRQGTPANGGAGPSGYGSSAPSDGAGPSPVPFSLADRSPVPAAFAAAPDPDAFIPGPGAILSAIMGFGAQQGAERRALAARQAREAEARRQGLWAQRLQEATAFRAELEAGFRAERMSAAEAVESWRAFEDGTVELAKGLGYSYRRAPVPTSYARRAAREASRAKIDAAEEQAAREEAEDNARFRHLHH